MNSADPESQTNGREWRVAVGLAVVLVCLRSIVPLAYHQLDFDADQAIVGLMAKRLAELRDFPLFFYGQNYMLGVQAWIAVPFVWLGGATVTMIRMPLFVLNVGVGALLLAAFARRGVRPALSFVAALPFIVTTPAVSAALYETRGASVEPFFDVLLLWVLRRRPVPFGILLCVATLHREFTVFALPAVAVALWIEGAVPGWRVIARAAAACVATWLFIDLLQLMLGAGSLAKEAQTIGEWLLSDPAGYPIRLYSVITRGVPVLFGGEPMRLLRFSVRSALTTGSIVAGLALATAVVVAVVGVGRAAANPLRRPLLRQWAFTAYLGVIALATLAAYGLNGGIDPDATPVTRYILFVLLLPIAVLGTFFAVERSRVWRAPVVAAMAVWGALTLTDNARLLYEYRTAPPPDEFRMLSDYLESHGIKYGRAQYWDAYVIDFLSQERVILASIDFIRIDEYQALVNEHADSAVSIERVPCTSGPPFMSWCVADPLKRIGR